MRRGVFPRKSVIVFLVAAMSLVAPVAVGDVRRVSDPRDTQGRFDVRAVRHGHAGELISHTIRTQGGWRWHDVRCFRDTSKCRATFRIYIFKKRFGDPVRYIHVFRRNGKTYGHVYRDRASCIDPAEVCFGSQSEIVGKVDLERPTSRKLKISFPRRYLPRDIERYLWSAYVIFWRTSACDRDSSGAPQGGYYCWDFVPAQSQPPIKHRL